MPSHTHSYSNAKYLNAQSGQANFAYGTTGSTTDLISESVKATGGSQAHNNMPPYIVVNYIIKAKQSATLKTSDEAKVLNVKTNTITDVYSCDYINKHLFGTVLFENSAGDNTGSITLNDSITKYPEVKIDYVIAVGDYITHESKRVSITSGHVIELSSVIAHSATIQLVHTGRYLFKDKAVTRVIETRSRITSAANVGWDGTSSGIYITKITGFIQ